MDERKRVGVNGARVARNIQRLREEKNLTRPELARKVAALEQPEQSADWELQPSKINALAISRIESGERRTDSDDLVLFAAALGVTPITLLMPYSENAARVATPLGRTLNTYYWAWLRAQQPLFMHVPGPEPSTDERRQARQFFNDSLPSWSPELEQVPSDESWHLKLDGDSAAGPDSGNENGIDK